MASRFCVIFLVCAVARLPKVISADTEADKVIVTQPSHSNAILIDLNKDGKWNFAEYLQRDENLIKFERERFDEMDKNKDKVITLEENKDFFIKQADVQAQQDKVGTTKKTAKVTPKPKSSGSKATPKPKPKPKNH